MTAKIYISKEQHLQKRAQERKLAEEYEIEKAALDRLLVNQQPNLSGRLLINQQPNLSGSLNTEHKYTGFAFIDKRLTIDFVDGEPKNAMHNGILLGDGSCSFKREKSDDFAFPIPLTENFFELLKSHPNMHMTLQHIYDGFIDADEAKAFDMNGELLEDLTIY